MLSTRLVPFVAPQAGQPAQQQTGLSALARQPGHRQPLDASWAKTNCCPGEEIVAPKPVLPISTLSLVFNVVCLVVYDCEIK